MAPWGNSGPLRDDPQRRRARQARVARIHAADLVRHLETASELPPSWADVARVLLLEIEREVARLTDERDGR